MKEVKNYSASGNFFSETEKAIQLSFTWESKYGSGGREFEKVWFPKSQIKFTYKDVEHNFASFEIPFWLLYKNQDKSDFLRDSNANSIWCDIFRQQDRNGLSEHGYAL